jgi:hypothetical protein
MMLDFYASHCHASVKKALNGVLLLCAYARLAEISTVIQQNYRKMCFPWSIWSVVSVIKMELQFLFNSGGSEIHFLTVRMYFAALSVGCTSYVAPVHRMLSNVVRSSNILEARAFCCGKFHKDMSPDSTPQVLRPC